MRTTIAIISALAATVAASNVYTTVDVTITSCPPEVSSCPGDTSEHAQTVYSTVDVTITSCAEEVSSCPGKPTSTPTAYVTPYLSSVYAVSSSTVAPVMPPGTTPVSSKLSTPAVSTSAYISKSSGSTTTVAPYPTSIVTMSTSKAPVASGTGVPRPSANGTTTSPPIASFTGAASSLSATYGTFAGVAAIVALFMAY